MKIKLQSGKELEITVVNVKLASDLLRIVKSKISDNSDLVDICLDEDVLKIVLECGKKAFYDGKRVDTLDIFENNREDMVEVLVKIIGENINPFSKTPLIEY